MALDIQKYNEEKIQDEKQEEVIKEFVKLVAKEKLVYRLTYDENTDPNYAAFTNLHPRQKLNIYINLNSDSEDTWRKWKNRTKETLHDVFDCDNTFWFNRWAFANQTRYYGQIPGHGRVWLEGLIFFCRIEFNGKEITNQHFFSQCGTYYFISQLRKIQYYIKEPITFFLQEVIAWKESTTEDDVYRINRWDSFWNK